MYDVCLKYANKIKIKINFFYLAASNVNTAFALSIPSQESDGTKFPLAVVLPELGTRQFF